MANSDRGVMKIDLQNVDKQAAIVKRVDRGGTAGVPYETIKELTGVMQLDRLNETNGVILFQDDQKKEHLKTITLP